MKATWFQATIKSIEKVSKTKMTFSMQVDSDLVFKFEAGQFITMDLPLGEKRRQRWRSYSIANITNSDNILTFGIGYLDQGLASQYFFETMKIGDTIKFKGPDGAFVLPQNLDRPIVMIANGTGVVPFVSMIRQIIKNALPYRHLHLIYGSRREEDILYHQELLAIELAHKNFKLDLVLSRDQNWAGPKGHVHQVYQSAYPEKDDSILYLLCGWSKMIDEAMVNLFPKVENPQKQIKYELYG